MPLPGPSARVLSRQARWLLRAHSRVLLPSPGGSSQLVDWGVERDQLFQSTSAAHELGWAEVSAGPICFLHTPTGIVLKSTSNTPTCKSPSQKWISGNPTQNKAYASDIVCQPRYGSHGQCGLDWQCAPGECAQRATQLTANGL